MIRLAKNLASILPIGLRDGLQRCWYTYRIRLGSFYHYEPEFAKLSEWLSPGDWVLDIGANIGIYTREMSRLVGPTGRVLAFEPVPSTFRFLVHNSRLFPHANITFLNVAVSSDTTLLGMDVPLAASGLPASALASVSEPGNARVLGFALDRIDFPQLVSLVKIDVEGYETAVLQGMMRLIERHRPKLIIEGFDEAIRRELEALGYSATILPESPNTVFVPGK